jgi:hypothetical protein
MIRTKTKGKVVQVYNEFEGAFDAVWDAENNWWESVDARVLGNFEANAVVRQGFLFSDMASMNEAISHEQYKNKPRGEFGYWSSFRVYATSESNSEVFDKSVTHLMKRATKKDIQTVVSYVKTFFPNTAFEVVVDCVWYQAIDGETMPTDSEAVVKVYKAN